MPLSSVPTQEEKNQHYRWALRSYTEAISRGDVEAVLALYAENAELEDPVGSGRFVRGMTDLRAFYTRVCGRNLSMTINGHVSAGKSDIAAAPIHVEVGASKMDCISVARFNDEGLIVRYDAIWGPGDIDGPDPSAGQSVT